MHLTRTGSAKSVDAKASVSSALPVSTSGSEDRGVPDSHVLNEVPGEFAFGGDWIQPMHDYFARQIELATRLGVERILVDPGMGFYYRNLQDSAQRVRFQMTTFLNTFRFRTLGYPICHALPHAFEYFGEEVRCAEPFFAVLAALGKTDLFRTHEVPRVRGVLETLRAYR